MILFMGLSAEIIKTENGISVNNKETILIIGKMLMILNGNLWY